MNKRKRPKANDWQRIGQLNSIRIGKEVGKFIAGKTRELIAKQNVTR